MTVHLEKTSEFQFDNCAVACSLLTSRQNSDKKRFPYKLFNLKHCVRMREKSLYDEMNLILNSIYHRIREKEITYCNEIMLVN